MYKSAKENLLQNVLDHSSLIKTNIICIIHITQAQFKHKYF